MVRNTYSFDQKEQSKFWYIIKDSFDGLGEHSSNERKKIRKALRCFVYKKVDRQLIVNEGFNIVKRVHENYVVKDRVMNEAIFQEFLELWDEENNEFWGAFDLKNGKFAGFAVVRVFGNSCFYDTVTIYPEYKHNASYPYYGFFFKLNEYYLYNQKFRYVADGARSITEHSNIQPFLEKNFKFRKAYCKLKIRYKWWFGIIVRMLLPFRNVIRNRNVKAVLNMHRMQYG